MAAMFPLTSVTFTHTEEDYDEDSDDFDDAEEIDELEVDELVSSGPEESNIPAVKRTKRPPRKAAPERKPGHIVVPIERIQTVIEADGGLAGFPLSKEALFVVSAATEAFIKRLSQVAQQTTQTQGRYTINYPDMASATEQYQEFMFLKDTIPMPLSITEALERREALERDLVEEDPALTSPATLQLAVPTPVPAPAPAHMPAPVPAFALPSVPSPIASTSRASSKSHTNGHASKANGKSSSKKTGKKRQAYVNGVNDARASSEQLEGVGDFLATHPYNQSTQFATENGVIPPLRPQVSLDAIASRHSLQDSDMDVDPLTQQELDSTPLSNSRRHPSTGSTSSRASSHVSTNPHHAPDNSLSRGRSTSSGIAERSPPSGNPFAALLHDPERPGRTIYSQKQQ